MLVGPFQWTPICHEHSHRLSRQVFPGSLGHFLARTELATQTFSMHMHWIHVRKFQLISSNHSCFFYFFCVLKWNITFVGWGLPTEPTPKLSWFSYQWLSAWHRREHAIVDTPKLPTNHSCFLPEFVASQTAVSLDEPPGVYEICNLISQRYRHRINKSISIQNCWLIHQTHWLVEVYPHHPQKSLVGYLGNFFDTVNAHPLTHWMTPTWCFFELWHFCDLELQ